MKHKNRSVYYSSDILAIAMLRLVRCHPAAEWEANLRVMGQQLTDTSLCSRIRVTARGLAYTHFGGNSTRVGV